MLLDGCCKQAAKCSLVNDVEAEQGWVCLGIHRLAHAPQLIRQRQRFSEECVGRLVKL